MKSPNQFTPNSFSQRLLLVIGCVLWMAQIPIQAQKIDGVEKTGIVYRYVKHTGISVNSTGLGIHYRRGRNLTGFSSLLGDFSFSSMRNPKEIRSVNAFSDNSGGYRYGKLNNLFILRAGIGKQKTVNAKADKGGVEIGYGFYGGLSAAIYKPVYLTVFYVDDQDGGIREKVAKYDPDLHYPDNISGKAGFFKGIGETQFRAGAYATFLLNFEFGKEQQKLRMVETGVTVDFVPAPLQTMAFNKPSASYLSFFIRIVYGKQWNRK